MTPLKAFARTTKIRTSQFSCASDLFSEGCGGNFSGAHEGVGEVVAVAEPTGGGDILNASFAVVEQETSGFNATLATVMRRSEACALAEKANKCIHVHCRIMG
jgi:hypothetical protein